MMEMNHPTAEHLEGFVEGILPVRLRAFVESHLQECSSCQTQAEEWRALFGALEGLTHFEPAPGFADRVVVFTALARLPHFEPSADFSDRVMAAVRVAPKASWQERAAWAGALITKASPKSTFGWAMATAMLALPMLLGGGTVAWLLSKSYVSPAALWAMTSNWVVEGLQGIGSTAVTGLMRTDLAVWTAATVTDFMTRAGLSGLGLLAAAGAGTIALSTWILYRNLFRTPSREAHYVSYSF